MKAELRKRITIILLLVAAILTPWIHFIYRDEGFSVATFLFLAFMTAVLVLFAAINILILLGKTLIYFQERNER
ncbi:hypothetical protein ACIQUG_04085 [Ensifer sp. NPDC090286]|uniref:hypothetical protein n=1 Tax=Ensifer sp. NPDC090286 TaxID=3363991 RepID=UPI00383A1F9D